MTPKAAEAAIPQLLAALREARAESLALVRGMLAQNTRTRQLLTANVAGVRLPSGDAERVERELAEYETQLRDSERRLGRFVELVERQLRAAGASQN